MIYFIYYTSKFKIFKTLASNSDVFEISNLVFEINDDDYFKISYFTCFTDLQLHILIINLFIYLLINTFINGGYSLTFFSIEYK